MKLHDWTIDIGNSRTKWAVFEGNEMLAQGVWEELEESRILSALTNHPPRAIILSTVGTVPSQQLEGIFRQGGYYLRLDEKTPLPFINAYRTPATLGKDRLAVVAGAQAIFPAQNCLVVDAGTCITTDFLRADGTYLGGNISPGIHMRLKAMHSFTAKLPLVDMETLSQETLLGDSTTSALQRGAIQGAALEIEALANRLEEQYGSLHTVITGGDGAILAAFLKNKIFVQPNLVLLGLKQILEHNV